MNKSLVSMAIALALVAGSAHAERAAHRHSFTADKTRTTAKGTFTKHTEQNVTDNGFTRSGEFTGPNGKTSSRDVTATVDKDTNTITKDISKTGPNGQTSNSTVVKTYSKNDGGAE